MARPKDPELRDRLIASATVEFASKGFGGASMAEIGRAAGVTKGGVYYHFRGKEPLFFAALDHWREVRRAELQLPVRSALGGAEGLRRFLADYLGFHFRTPDATNLLRVLATELRGRFTSQLRDDTRQEHRWMRARIRELLFGGVRDGSLFIEDPAFGAFLLASAVGGVLEQWQTAPRDVEPFCDPEQLAESLVARYATGRQARALPATGAAEFDF